MARRRFLPEYVSRFRDRHGRWRYRFRRKGYPSGYINHELGSPEFLAAYAAFLRAGSQPPAPRSAPGTVADLVERYCAVPERLGPSEITQTKVRAIVDRFRQEHGHRMVADFEFEHIDTIVAARRGKTMVDTPRGPRPMGGVHAARKLRFELHRLFAFAVKVRMRSTNPVADAERIKTTVAERTGGFHTWSEEEIARFRARHPLGSMPRLALELLLWTDQRRSDVVTMGPKQVSDGRILVVQAKGGKRLWLPIAPQLRAALAAMPATDQPTYLLSAHGTPFSKKSFGNWFRRQCDAAGLEHCSAHGLRKATMRRGAELGMSNQMLKAISGHSEDDEVALYTAGSDQVRLADDAIRQISAWEQAKGGEE